MPVIEFRTLGAVDLFGADGRELHSLLAQPKRIALLAYLCIAQPRGFHRRDTLLGLFWPNADQEHARTSLRKALHILRRALGDDAILSRGDDDVSVDFERISCDVVKFDENLQAGRVEEALELYRGDLLTGFFVEDAPEFEQWLHSERARLRLCAGKAAYAAAEREEARGDLVAAASLARRSLDLADTDERTLRKVIELQWKAGEQAAALEQYERFARHLAAEYETQPSAETRSLIERIRSGLELPEREATPASALGRSINATAASPLFRATEGEKETRRGRLPRWALYAAGAVGILISGGLIWGLVRPEKSNQVVRYALQVDSTEAMAEVASWSGRLAISPDGSRLIYVGGRGGQLLIRPRNQLHATTMFGTQGAQTPFFSPDGERVGFLTERHVHISSTNGGPLVTVASSLTGVAGASWGQDGFIYVDGQGYAGLVRVETKPGAVPTSFTVLDTASGEIDHAWPDVLPNGKGVLFAVTFTGTNGVKDSLSYAIAVADIPSGKHRVIVQDAMYPRYAPSGHLLYVTSRKTLMIAPFDQNSMKVSGEPSTLIEGMRLGRFGSADLAVSASGTLVYVIGGGQGQQELVWVTRDGKKQAVDPEWEGEFWGPALSPDGKRLAITRRLNTAKVDVLVKQLDRGPSINMTVEEGGIFPAWTPDGSSVTFTSDEAESANFLTSKADGSAPAMFQFHERRRVFSSVWSPDGKWLVYGTSVGAPDSGDIAGIRPGIDTSSVPLVATRFRETTPALSPDGHWLAYTSNESGQNQIYVVPFPNSHSAKWAVSTSGGTDPQWSHRGNELFYRNGAEDLVAVEVKTAPTFSLGRAAPLFSTTGLEMLPGIKGYAVSSDDRRFLMIRLAPFAAEKLIVVDNWFDEVKTTTQNRLVR